MSEQIIIEQCSPTLAGLKTASLFPYRYDSKEILFDEIREFNNRLLKKGVRMIPVLVDDCKALIYLYRPKKLKSDIENETATKILQNFGYDYTNTNRCVFELVQRLKSQSDFPHEIGLFLGYPPEDVYGFIKNKACNHKLCGYWKVYGDERKAQKTFDKLKKCTDVYKNQLDSGRSIERLTVAI